jgi:hypothetical protein
MQVVPYASSERTLTCTTLDVRRYDSNTMSLEGPSGLLVRVNKLLDAAPSRMDEQTKNQLLEDFLTAVRRG